MFVNGVHPNVGARVGACVEGARVGFDVVGVTVGELVAGTVGDAVGIGQLVTSPQQQSRSELCQLAPHIFGPPAI